MAYVRTEYPQWSWSFSRQRIFASCLRRYYYTYYASHNGWERDAPPEAATAYRLKQLANLYTTLGDAVHKTAESMVARAAQGRELPPVQAVEEEIRRHLRRVWKSSRENREAFLLRPNRVDMLREFYYGTGVSDALIERINQRLVQAAQGLVRSQVWTDLRRKGTLVVSCEQFETISLAGTPVYAVPDLIYRDGEGRWVVVDWKSGEEVEENRDQVALYVLFVQVKYAVPAAKITARLEYLIEERWVELQFSDEHLQEVKDKALASMEEMKKLLQDPRHNIPRPKEQFDLTEAREQCPFCNFYELCEQELELSAG
ncbi:MAG TPA: PD-(D/E)XK nuclease family protein [Limnochordia bacterium]|nr:PD-(D/E)XK nuclease family protein [Limnochordia bacterium]